MSKKSKLIRLDPEVYGELEEFQFKHESFSNAVWRLLQVHRQMREMLRKLGGELPERSKRK